MKDSEVYLEAAKLIDSGKFIFSCNAIDHVQGTYNSLLSRGYPTLMGFTSHQDFENANSGREAERNHRVLLLCLAVAIAEDEGR